VQGRRVSAGPALLFGNYADLVHWRASDGGLSRWAAGLAEEGCCGDADGQLPGRDNVRGPLQNKAQYDVVANLVDRP
jgi:hypothetical protein